MTLRIQGKFGVRANFLSLQKLLAAMFSQKKSIMLVHAAYILKGVSIVELSESVFCHDRKTGIKPGSQDLIFGSNYSSGIVSAHRHDDLR